jgi:DNA polymerase-1
MAIDVAPGRPQLLGDCAKCPLFVDLDYKHLVRGYGVADRLVVIGEAPGASEVSQGRPFVGESGRLIRKVLSQLGIDPDEDVYWTNAVLCRPPGNKTPTPTAIKACNDRLVKVELPMVMPKKILALGGIALSGMMGTPAGLPITKWHGKGMYVKYGPDHGDHPLDSYTYDGCPGCEDAGEAFAVATYHPAAVMRDLDLFRDFVRDIQKLISRSSPYGDIPIKHVVPTVPKNALDALELLLNSSGAVSCDIETTGLNPLSDEIISIGFGAVGEGVSPSIIIRRDTLDNDVVGQLRLYDLMSKYDGDLVFQNGKFDLQFLDVFFGMALRPKHFKDTMILHYVLDERPIGRYAAHGLKDLARIYYDVDDYRFDFNAFFAKRANATPEELEKAYDELFAYQAKDTVYTAMLYDDLGDELLEEYADTMTKDGTIGHKLLNETLYPGTLAFTEIELYGAMIDVPYLQAKKRDYTKLLDDQLKELQALAWPEFNPSSPVQVQKLFFDIWKLDSSRGKSTEREALDSLIKRTRSAEHVAGIRKVIEYRLRSKVLATYIDGMLRRVDADGRLRTDIRIAGTSTGRLSSSDPNLQNIPTLMGPEIRNAFIATEGHTFVEVDYSQLELRVAAFYSRDKGMLQTFKDGKDIHVAVAATMFRKPEDKVTEYERYLAKYVDFGVIYGRGARSLVEGWEMDYLEEKLGGVRWTLPEAEKFLAEFLAGFPQLTKWMRRQEQIGLTEKFVSSPLGRRRRFPFVTDALRSHIGRQAVNTPIQGFASDICLTSLIKLHAELPEGAHVLFPVHDAIYFEVETAILDDVLPQIRRTMETNLPAGIDKIVPVPVKVKIGQRWGEVKEIK